MKKTHFPVIIGAGLLSAASLIAGLASADIDSNKHEAGKYNSDQNADRVAAKQLDINNDGKISLNELTARQTRRFAKLDTDGDGSIDMGEFNARLIAMFNRMDANADGFLDQDEVSRNIKKHGKRHNHNYGTTS